MTTEMTTVLKVRRRPEVFRAMRIPAKGVAFSDDDIKFMKELRIKASRNTYDGSVLIKSTSRRYNIRAYPGYWLVFSDKTSEVSVLPGETFSDQFEEI